MWSGGLDLKGALRVAMRQARRISPRRNRRASEAYFTPTAFVEDRRGEIAEQARRIERHRRAARRGDSEIAAQESVCAPEAA